MRNSRNHNVATILRQLPEASDALFIAIADRNDDTPMPGEYFHQLLSRSTPIGDLAAFAQETVRKYRPLLLDRNTSVRKTSPRRDPAHGSPQSNQANIQDGQSSINDRQAKGTVFARLRPGEGWTAIPAAISERFRLAGAEVRLPSEMAQMDVVDAGHSRYSQNDRE